MLGPTAGQIFLSERDLRTPLKALWNTGFFTVNQAIFSFLNVCSPEERFDETYVFFRRYTPVADLDYGTLSCAASNEVGTQLAPCVFQMVAAGMTVLILNKPYFTQKLKY